MKQLFIVRHAKSDWDNALEDFDRPLNQRGHKDAPMMAKRINELGFRPAILISSPAQRAITTARYFAMEYGYPNDCIRLERDIYDIGQRFTLDMITNLSFATDSAMIFGHNPDHSYVATYLSNEPIGNMPTCAVVGIQFETDDWRNIKKSTSKLLFFEFPKER